MGGLSAILCQYLDSGTGHALNCAIIMADTGTVFPLISEVKMQQGVVSALYVLFLMHDSWLDALFCTGVKRDLQEDDLSLCPEEMKSERLMKKFER